MSHNDALKTMQPKKEFFVGIDSDGCAFPTMELKHKECFIPNIVKYYDLQSVSKYAREAAEFVNLYSKWRGINRFPALIMAMELTAERPAVQKSGVRLPDLTDLKKWVDSGAPLGNPALKKAVEETVSPCLRQALEWSEAVNRSVDWMVTGCSPFAFVRESLEKLSQRADIVVVSATPGAALEKEWTEHGIARFARVIAGQEMGSKKEHLALAAAGKYPPEKILMIGDAPGDMKAARANQALFFPVNPGAEEDSWERLFREGFDRFVTGTYAGAYEAALIREFEALLPDVPPWKK
jgi:phosphoglycolate phosphatase-like HAD superfamily hydrolase